MKNILTILFLFSLNAGATNYYFKNSGADGNTGLSDAQAWQTTTKFNSFYASLSPGDSVLFKRGDTFYGKLSISRSGSAGFPIVIGAYGTGAKPIITGFTDVSAWTDQGSNIWISNSVVSTLAYTNVVSINGVNTAMGRYPNPASSVSPAYENLLFWSEQLNVTGFGTGNPWGNFTHAAITANQAVDLTGGTTMELFTISGGSASIYQTINTIVPGTNYTVSWDIKRGTKTDLEFAVYDRTHSAYITSPASYYSSTSTTVQRITKTFTAPSGTTSVDIIFAGNGNDFTQGTFYLGRVQMTDRAATYIVTTNGPENPGYLTYQSFVTNTTITSSSLNSATTNWNGGEVVIKKQLWIIDRNPITAHSGGTLTYTASSPYYGQNSWGFFIQNDSLTLDQQNEWFYSPNKKLKIYSTSSPTGVQVASIDTLVVLPTNKSYATFDNISFTGANFAAFHITNFSNLTIQNCSFDFNYNSIYGANAGTSSSLVLQNNTINHSNNNAVVLTTSYSSATITGNVIRNTGMLEGMSGSSDGQCQGILLNGGSGSLIQYNEVDSTGYIAISFPNGDATTVSNNLVNYFCMVKDDGGGIYTHTNATTKVISGNIILNGIGNTDGTNGSTSLTMGIYVDRNTNTSGVSILNNTVAHIKRYGIFISGAHDCIVRNNTVYNADGSAFLIGTIGSDTTYNTTVKGNIFFAKTAIPLTLLYFYVERINPGLTSDSNYYARPIDDNLTINTQTLNPTPSYNYLSLATWRTYSGKDANSNKSPKTISDTSELRFEYNATASPVVVPLSFNYIDVIGNIYNGTITVPAYSSAILIQNGAITIDPNLFKTRRIRFISH